MNCADKSSVSSTNKPITKYHERKISKTLYRVTSIYKGEIDFTKAIEDLIIRKILRDENVSQMCSENL